MAKRITVVVSQGHSNHPAKRGLEEDIVAALLMEPGVDVTVIPNLYDLRPDGTGVLALSGISGDMVVASWHYERAAHWTLDRLGIRGRLGETLVKLEPDEDDDEPEPEDEDKERVIDTRDLPARRIYHLDLRARDEAAPFVEEVKRIAAETSVQVVGLGGWIGGSPAPEQLQRFAAPTNDTALGPPALANGNGKAAASANGDGEAAANKAPVRIEEEGGRRWYPVIDFSRCTNCMECIDFCLFGVYGVDSLETILVEQPDNCRKGCPACSRVCPENAIVFPQHKSPAIAGSPEAAGGLKIDLSRLFGAPEGNESAADVAVRERDEQLVMAGRDAVLVTVGMPKRQQDQPAEPKDDLDDLLDELDDLDL